MTDKHIVKVRMLGACVIITVPAAVRQFTGIESGDYVFVEATGKRGFAVAKGAIPAKKKKVADKAPKQAKKKLVPAKKKVVKSAPKKKVAAPKPAPKPKLTAPPKKKLIVKAVSAPAMPLPPVQTSSMSFVDEAH